MNQVRVEQCVQGEGLVQINVELKVDRDTGRGKINIVDVLKPADEPSEEERSDDETETSGRDCVTRWVVCTQFRKEQERLAMPTGSCQARPFVPLLTSSSSPECLLILMTSSGPILNSSGNASLLPWFRSRVGGEEVRPSIALDQRLGSRWGWSVVVLVVEEVQELRRRNL